jgi:hypothetical protein
MMFAFLVYFIVTVITTPVGTSHLSHVGGFLSGLCPALLFLPHLRSARCAPLVCTKNVLCSSCNAAMMMMVLACKIAQSGVSFTFVNYLGCWVNTSPGKNII